MTSKMRFRTNLSALLKTYLTIRAKNAKWVRLDRDEEVQVEKQRIRTESGGSDRPLKLTDITLHV